MIKRGLSKVYNNLPLWKRILLIVDIFVFILIFISIKYMIFTIPLFVLLALLVFGLNKNSWKKILFFGLLGFLIGILPFFSDIICSNIFGTSYFYNYNFLNICENIFLSPWYLLAFLISNIFGLKGEQGFVIFFIGPLFYIVLGVFLGIVWDKLNKKSRVFKTNIVR